MRVPGPGMPPHRYVMISEGDRFFINNDPGGNLTAAGAGWTYPQQHPHPGGSGGVSMQWAPDGDPTKPGWYYSVTGGASVGFARSRDLQTWEGGYHVAMSQQADLQHRGVCVCARARARVCVCVYVCVYVCVCVSQCPIDPSLPHTQLRTPLAVGEYQIAPYNGFPESAARKGFSAMAAPANWVKWCAQRLHSETGRHASTD